MATIPEPTQAGLGAQELRAWRGLLQTHAAVTGALDAEMRAAHDLSLSSYEVLMFLADAPDHRLRMAQIADRVLLSRSGLTRLVDRLERQGLLTRRRCESDARGLFAEITPEGRRVFDAARKTHLDGVREMFLKHFSEDELRLLATYWERVRPGAADLIDGD